jgi:hypothetical protein
VRECGRRLTADDRGRLVDELVVLDCRDPEQGKVHAARDAALEIFSTISWAGEQRVGARMRLPFPQPPTNSRTNRSLNHRHSLSMSGFAASLSANAADMDGLNFGRAPVR